MCLRYFNVFGPRQDPASPYSGVLAKFITQMLGENSQRFLATESRAVISPYVDNVVEANLLACKADAKGVSRGQVFNVATGRRTDLYQTFLILKKLTGYSGRREIRS